MITIHTHRSIPIDFYAVSQANLRRQIPLPVATHRPRDVHYATPQVNTKSDFESPVCRVTTALSNHGTRGTQVFSELVSDLPTKRIERKSRATQVPRARKNQIQTVVTSDSADQNNRIDVRGRSVAIVFFRRILIANNSRARGANHFTNLPDAIKHSQPCLLQTQTERALTWLCNQAAQPPMTITAMTAIHA